MGQPIQQCRGQFGITKYIGPFRKAQVGGDNRETGLVYFRFEVEFLSTDGRLVHQTALGNCKHGHPLVVSAHGAGVILAATGTGRAAGCRSTG